MYAYVEMATIPMAARLNKLKMTSISSGLACSIFSISFSNEWQIFSAMLEAYSILWRNSVFCCTARSSLFSNSSKKWERNLFVILIANDFCFYFFIRSLICPCSVMLERVWFTGLTVSIRSINVSPHKTLGRTLRWSVAILGFFRLLNIIYDNKASLFYS